MKSTKLETNTDLKLKLKTETKSILNKFYSIVDKAVKKSVIKKNTASRKKSNLFLKFNVTKKGVKYSENSFDAKYPS